MAKETGKRVFSPGYKNVKEGPRAGEREDPKMQPYSGKQLGPREFQIQPSSDKWTAKKLLITPKGKSR